MSDMKSAFFQEPSFRLGYERENEGVNVKKPKSMDINQPLAQNFHECIPSLKFVQPCNLSWLEILNLGPNTSTSLFCHLGMANFCFVLVVASFQHDVFLCQEEYYHLVDKYVPSSFSTVLWLLYSSAWLTGYEHPLIDKINQRIEDLTGLEMDTAEELQVNSSLAESCGHSAVFLFDSLVQVNIK